MTRDTKIRITVTVIGWVLSAVLQAFSFAFYLGKLTEKVNGLGQRMDRIEQTRGTSARTAKPNEVKSE